MKFEIPVASRERLDRLLEYLGERAEDFKKCFDVESEWCWKYADLMLRGLEKRELEYGEGHHIVPFSWYKMHGCTYYSKHPILTEGNSSTLSYGEHLYAHYCAAHCALGKMLYKMINAFWGMYSFNGSKKRYLDIYDSDLTSIIPDIEARKLLLLDERVSNVSSQGRHHSWEVPRDEYIKEYYKANKEIIAARSKAYRESNKDKISAREKAYREANKEKIAVRRKAYREANKEKFAAREKAYREANKEKIAVQSKAYREANKEKIAVQRKAYREANKEKFAARAKAYMEANKEKIAVRSKAYREANKEKIAAREKAYREANKEKIASYREQHRAELRQKQRARNAIKKSIGLRYRKNRTTGKYEWILPIREYADEHKLSIFFAPYDPTYVELDTGGPFGYVEEDYLQPTGT